MMLNPSQYQSVDESMVLFKDVAAFGSQPNEPIMLGYKVWVRADSSGLMCEFQIYTENVGDTAETNLEQSGTTSNTITDGKAPPHLFRQLFSTR